MKNINNLAKLSMTLIAIAVLIFFRSAAQTTVHLEFSFNTSPSRIYKALMDEKEFSAFTGKAAGIRNQEGAPFKRFNGAITGRNIELIPDRRIVMAWHSEAWPSGVYSIVRLELEAGETGTRLTLDQTGIPTGFAEGQKTNWPLRVFDPLAKIVNSK